MMAVYLGLFVPLFSSIALMLFSKNISRNLAGMIGSISVLISFLCFSTFLIHDITPASFTLYEWISVKGLSADFKLHLDHLSLLMTLIITGVGFLIHVYANGYMDHDKDYARFFCFMNFFVFAMLLLVLAGNLLLLFVGWEGVGLASYLLIGFWYEKPKAAYAAVKAFVVNRIGDLGLLLGILLTLYLFGTTDIAEVSNLAQNGVSTSLLTLLTSLYFVGAIGKSAQLPLQTWLPDAMEGPTPVSALIHAATMVTAGVYLVVRMHSVFLLAPETLNAIGIIGGATALFAALAATSQVDLKRVLAYSTVSQLGFMFLACGAGAFYSAMFHLTTHAFIKALLFLSAGNVVHMMHGTTNMYEMGGLKKEFPVTHWMFLIGILALSGLPPFAAFFSKDLILEQEYLSGFHVLFYIGALASCLTAFYLTRAYYLTFLGTPQGSREGIFEAPRVMLLPLFVLAVLSAIGGVLGYTFGGSPLLEGFLAEVGITPVERDLSGGFVITHETFLLVGGTLLGIGAAVLIYTRFKDKLKDPLQLLKDGFFFDEIYQKLIISPLQLVSRVISDYFEPEVITGTTRKLAIMTQSTAIRLQQFQSGQIRSYAAWMALGACLLIIYYFTE